MSFLSIGTHEEKKEIYRLAKVKKKPSRGFRNVWCIKSEDKRTLLNDEDMKKR